MQPGLMRVLDFFDRYDHLLIPEPNTGCLLWLGAQASAGYGHGHRDGIHFYAHRASFECVNGIGSLDGLVCRHRCDFPPCCEPTHLLDGSQRDNMADCHERGRSNTVFGERAGRAKLIDADIPVIRAMAAAGTPMNEITELYPIRRNAMTALVEGKTWRHMGPGVSWTRQKGGRRRR